MPERTEIELSVRDVLAAHFVMWQTIPEKGGPKGEWVCSCGLKFGFSDSAIDHVAERVGDIHARGFEAGHEQAREDIAAITRERDTALAMLSDGNVRWSAIEAERDKFESWWTSAEHVRMDVERVLDGALGTEEEDGAGAGLVADVRLALATAWDEGAVWAGAIRLAGTVSPDNPYRVNRPAEGGGDRG